MNGRIINAAWRLFAAGALAASLTPVRAAATDPVTWLPASEVSAAFAKGRPLLEVGGYKVHASRREAPGMAEVHTQDTDVIHVIEGTATILTGGSVVNGKT